MTKTSHILILLCLILAVSCWEVDVAPCNTPNCTRCDDTDTTCIQCASSFYLNAEQCSQCSGAIDNCDRCSANSTFAVTCEACSDGYYLYNEGQQCRSCFLEIPDCLKCTLDNINVLTCDLCETNQFLTVDAKQCKSCFGLIANCQTCQEAAKFHQTTCSTCQQGYDLSDDKLTCTEGGSSSTWIIIVSVVGGVLLIGVGFMVYRCIEKKKRENNRSKLLSEEDY